MAVKLDTRQINDLKIQVAEVEGSAIGSFIEGIQAGQAIKESNARIEQANAQRDRAVIQQELERERIRGAQIENEQQKRNQEIQNQQDSEINDLVYGSGPIISVGDGGDQQVTPATQGIKEPITSPSTLNQRLEIGVNATPVLKGSKTQFRRRAEQDVQLGFEEAQNFKLKIEGVDSDGLPLNFQTGHTPTVRVMQYMAGPSEELKEAVRQSLMNNNGFTEQEVRQFELMSNRAVRFNLIDSLEESVGGETPGFIFPGQPISRVGSTDQQRNIIADLQGNSMSDNKKRLDSGVETNPDRITAIKQKISDDLTHLEKQKEPVEAMISSIQGDIVALREGRQTDSGITDPNQIPWDQFQAEVQRLGGRMFRKPLFNGAPTSEDQVTIIMLGHDVDEFPQAQIDTTLNADQAGVELLIEEETEGASPILGGTGGGTAIPGSQPTPATQAEADAEVKRLLQLGF